MEQAPPLLLPPSKSKTGGCQRLKWHAVEDGLFVATGSGTGRRASLTFLLAETRHHLFLCQLCLLVIPHQRATSTCAAKHNFPA